MAATSPLITIMKTVLATPPTAATVAKSLNPTGPIQDQSANAGLVLLKLEEAYVKVSKIITDTDSSDPNLTGLQGVQAGLFTSNSPSALVTAMTNAIAAGPTAATTAKALAPAGPIMLYLGMLHSVRVCLYEAKVLIGQMVNGTDASDPNLTALNNVTGALV